MSSAAANSNINLMNVYAPEEDARMLAVLVPAMETTLTELRYRELLANRLERLMELWQEEDGTSLTQQLLIKAAKELELEMEQGVPYPEIPRLGDWKAWARLLAQETFLIPKRFAHLGVTFPVTIEQNPDQIASLKGLFKEHDTQPSLAEWLGEAMYEPLRHLTL
ncbi:MAG: hypothetical protein ACKO7W_07025 [Elainella sp.]